MNRLDVKTFLSLHLVIAFLMSCTVLPAVVYAEDCPHTNATRKTIENYEPIVDNNASHEVVVWMQTICLDCLDISKTKLVSQEEPHQFVEDGSVLTCKWCEYQTMQEALQATPVPMLEPTDSVVTTAIPELLDKEYTQGDYKYKLFRDGNAAITEYTGSAVELTIPSHIDGHKVTGIGYAAFSECRSLQSVTIPDSVTHIGSAAFSYCTYLQSIVIPGSVTSIGVNPFDCCFSLKEIQVATENPVFSNADGVLYDKRNAILISYPCGATATEYVIPQGVQSIGDYAFSECEILEKVDIPNTVTNIGEGAFFACWALKRINIPDGVTTIGELAFRYCEGLSSITIPESVEEIGDDAFDECGENFVIYCAAGSYAESYAESHSKENGFRFVVNDGDSKHTAPIAVRPTVKPTASPTSKPTDLPCAHPTTGKVEGEVTDLGNGEWIQECYKVCTNCGAIVDVFYRGGMNVDIAIPSK